MSSYQALVNRSKHKVMISFLRMYLAIIDSFFFGKRKATQTCQFFFNQVVVLETKETNSIHKFF